MSGFVFICIFLHTRCVIKYSDIKLEIDFIKYNFRLLFNKKMKIQGSKLKKKKTELFFQKVRETSIPSLKFQTIHIWFLFFKVFMFQSLNIEEREA
jgi:hypothetical protein